MGVVDRIYGQPFDWGVSDCCTRACDVLRELQGVDPMAPLRGAYQDLAGALALIRAWGGWRRMCAALAAQAGLVAGIARPGAAVGLVKGAVVGFALAVCVPRGWAASIDCGVVILPTALESWGVPDG